MTIFEYYKLAKGQYQKVKKLLLNNKIGFFFGCCVICIGFVIMYYPNLKEIYKDATSMMGNKCKVDFTDNVYTFKVLILPFERSTVNHKEELERQLLKRFNDIKEKDKLDIQVEYDCNEIYPTTFVEARDYAKENGADLILFGDFFNEQKTSDYKVNVRWALVDREINNYYGDEYDTIKTFSSFAEIREGALKYDTEYIVYWVLGLEKLYDLNCNDAIDSFKKIEINFPIIARNDFNLYYYEGNCYDFLGKWDSSLISYKKALSLNYVNTKAHHNIGVNYVYLNKPFDALKHILITLLMKSERNEVISDKSLSHNALANILRMNFRMYELSRFHYLKAIEIDKYSDFIENYAQLLQYEFQMYDSSIVYYKQALELDSTSIFAKSNMSMAYCNLGAEEISTGKIEQGIQKLKIAIDIFPENAEPYYNLGVVYQDFIPRLDLAFSYYKLALLKNPKHLYSLENLGILYHRALNQTQNSLNCFYMILEIDSLNAKASLSIAMLYNDIGKKDSMSIYFENAMRLDPSLGTPENKKKYLRTK